MGPTCIIWVHHPIYNDPCGEKREPRNGLGGLVHQGGCLPIREDIRIYPGSGMPVDTTDARTLAASTCAKAPTIACAISAAGCSGEIGMAKVIAACIGAPVSATAAGATSWSIGGRRVTRPIAVFRTHRQTVAALVPGVVSPSSKLLSQLLHGRAATSNCDLPLSGLIPFS